MEQTNTSIDLNSMTLEQAKSIAYDLIMSMQRLQNDIALVQNHIAKLNQAKEQPEEEKK